MIDDYRLPYLLKYCIEQGKKELFTLEIEISTINPTQMLFLVPCTDQQGLNLKFSMGAKKK